VYHLRDFSKSIGASIACFSPRGVALDELDMYL
jgi:hypothetical protein